MASATFERLPILSKAPWRWLIYVTVFVLASHWLHPAARDQAEMLLWLLAAAQALWLLEVVLLKPSTRRMLLSFNGRVPRSIYWLLWTVAFNGVFLWETGFALIARAAMANVEQGFPVDELAALLILTLPLLPIAVWVGITVEVRRWHDLNRTGWFYLANFIPFAQLITYPYLLFFRGTWGRNNYGADPLSSAGDGPSMYGAVTYLNVALSIFLPAFMWIASLYVF